jgi:hypothetical protein
VKEGGGVCEVGEGCGFYCNPEAVTEGYYTSFRFLRDVISGDLTTERAHSTESGEDSFSASERVVLAIVSEGLR